ncbi:cytochrome c maturation protein CcmE [Pseudoroseicyclus tamaricis]|uniref:Cytochrome c-type biogenesis protein CcmE n=1 Tax=Pseudoroseicyclus tamaricis TaxID=2705421 RepID=A0A6B2JYN5_9RHOB|nr:cytochrome c maturation protein CcmE [Pseudoroseicyclus tamaricis]NDV01414.1 cytochrome c maturation protein CcmE [Pseudoroseicyclus tamaricis]
MSGFKSLKKRRRIQIIAVTFVALAGATALAGYAMRDGINYFRSPTQVAEAPPEPDEVFRLGGLVEDGSLVRGQGTQISFRVTDGSYEIPVIYDGILPDLFEENQGMIGQGRYINGTFEAIEILAKHDEDYQPRELTKALEEAGHPVDPAAADGAAVTN